MEKERKSVAFANAFLVHFSIRCDTELSPLPVAKGGINLVIASTTYITAFDINMLIMQSRLGWRDVTAHCLDGEELSREMKLLLLRTWHGYNAILTRWHQSYPGPSPQCSSHGCDRPRASQTRSSSNLREFWFVDNYWPVKKRLNDRFIHHRWSSKVCTYTG